MRVALVAPFVAAIDDRRPQLGGAQAIVAELATGLAARGHRITLIAARGSFVRGATLADLDVAADPESAFRADGAPAGPPDDGAFRAAAAWLAAHRSALDVVHGHAFDAPALDRITGPGVVHTLHLPPLDPAVVAAARRSRDALATVSLSARDSWRAAGVAVPHVLPNGIDVDAVPLGRGEGGYLAFAGRMSPEKGADVALRVAAALGLPIRLAGGIYDRRFFTERVAPLLASAGPAAAYLGPLDRPALLGLLGGARCTLLPVRWDEPFGLVALESLAAGTPVVAYARGGLTEMVVDGRSGRLVPPEDEVALIRAAADARELRRADCRADAYRFDGARMLDEHETLYRGLSASS